jgi:hypothetical protein
VKNKKKEKEKEGGEKIGFLLTLFCLMSLGQQMLPLSFYLRLL